MGHFEFFSSLLLTGNSVLLREKVRGFPKTGTWRAAGEESCWSGLERFGASTNFPFVWVEP